MAAAAGRYGRSANTLALDVTASAVPPGVGEPTGIKI